MSAQLGHASYGDATTSHTMMIWSDFASGFRRPRFFIRFQLTLLRALRGRFLEYRLRVLIAIAPLLAGSMPHGVALVLMPFGIRSLDISFGMRRRGLYFPVFAQERLARLLIEDVHYRASMFHAIIWISGIFLDYIFALRRLCALTLSSPASAMRFIFAKMRSLLDIRIWFDISIYDDTRTTASLPLARKRLSPSTSNSSSSHRAYRYFSSFMFSNAENFRKPVFRHFLDFRQFISSALSFKTGFRLMISTVKQAMTCAFYV